MRLPSVVGLQRGGYLHFGSLCPNSLAGRQLVWLGDKVDALHAYYPTHRINHRWEFSRDGHISTNRVESVHSRMRRAEMGVYNHLSGKYLDRYASEIAFRIDNARTDNGTIFEYLARSAMNHPIARDWLGCWQRRPKDA